MPRTADPAATITPSSIFDTDLATTPEGKVEFTPDNPTGSTAEPIRFPLATTGLAIGDIFYKTASATRAKASASSLATAKIEGIVIDIETVGEQSNVIGLPVGGRLTPAIISGLAAANVIIDDFDTYHLGLTAKPQLSPPTADGEITKQVIKQGYLTDGVAYKNGTVSDVAVTVTATGTDTLQEGMTRKTVVANSATAISRTLPAITSANNGLVFLYKNIGAGTLTLTNSIEGTANRQLTTNQRIEVLAQAGNWYIIG